MLLTEGRSFDEYIRRYGWAYDNRGHHAGQDWDWYYNSRTDLVLARREPSSVAILRLNGREYVEVWSGQIATSADLDHVMSLVEIVPVPE